MEYLRAAMTMRTQERERRRRERRDRPRTTPRVRSNDIIIGGCVRMARIDDIITVSVVTWSRVEVSLVPRPFRRERRAWYTALDFSPAFLG